MYKIFTFIFTLLIATQSQAGQLYRIVDEHGNVTYSDKIQADQKDNEAYNLNKNGTQSLKQDKKRSKEEQEIINSERKRVISEKENKLKLLREAEYISQRYESLDDFFKMKNSIKEKYDPSLTDNQEQISIIEKQSVSIDAQITNILAKNKQNEKDPEYISLKNKNTKLQEQKTSLLTDIAKEKEKMNKELAEIDRIQSIWESRQKK